ncbi:MAG: hypothetical protein QM756_23845 [Polyangiaceae bacterium]
MADVFEALTADRHYRRGMGPEQAFAILEEGIGRKFDGDVVAALARSWEGVRQGLQPAAGSRETAPA